MDLTRVEVKGGEWWIDAAERTRCASLSANSSSSEVDSNLTATSSSSYRADEVLARTGAVKGSVVGGPVEADAASDVGRGRFDGLEGVGGSGRRGATAAFFLVLAMMGRRV